MTTSNLLYTFQVVYYAGSEGLAQLAVYCGGVGQIVMHVLFCHCTTDNCPCQYTLHTFVSTNPAI